MLLPVIGLVQVGLQSVADRYTYLPTIGLLLGFTWAVAEFLHGKRSMVTGSANHLGHNLRPTTAGSTWLALGSVLCCCFLLLILATGTRRQLTFWRNTEVLMNRALEIDPHNYVAHQNLGRYFARLGRTAEAKAHHERVRELDPFYVVPGTNSAAP
jgi:tetratricopeptide (TPR) repeat protein